jgi:general secretion pathway protein L
MLGAFVAWWIGQLADLLPSSLRRSALVGADALVIDASGACRGIGAVTITERRGAKETPLGDFAITAPEFRRLPRSPKLPAVLRLTEADVLQQVLTLPLATRAELDQVLAFEMDRLTPFSAEEVFWTHRIEAIDRQHEQLSVCLLLLPKIHLAPLLVALAQADIAPQWMEVGNGPGEFVYLPLTGERDRPQHWSRQLVWPAAACCALLALGAIGIPFARQAVQLAGLDREVEAGRAMVAQADGARREIDRLSRSAELIDSEFGKAGRPLEAVAAITRLLPDDTYLTELELRQRKLTIGGRSANAARLISALAVDHRFRNPSFAAPVTRLDAAHAEVFSIVADMEGEL